MAYKDIPLPTDVLSVSQQDIRGNFSQANTSFGVDHYAFNDITAQNGIHKQVRMKNQAAPGFAPGDGVIYTTTFDGNFWPAWQNALGSTLMLGSASQPLANGFASISGSILIQWGIISKSGPVTPVLFVTANKNFPSNCFNVLLTPTVNTLTTGQLYSVLNGSVTNTGFSFGTSTAYPNGSDFFWVAIGN